ncbi:MAG: gliding motility-associated C-terminal domain-containing protein [Bacteroidia bacterium]|nr:gliding motility-associated C-terminal domain-containing protein [Bacteroidia bacterium]
MLILRTKYLLFLLVVVAALLSPESLKAQAVVIGHPSDTAVCVGGQAQFRVLALNTVSYQWQENDGVGWYNITQAMTYASGYTTQILTITDANLGLNGYKYRCVVTDGQGLSDISQAANFGVNDPPIIIQQPADRVVCKSDVAVFSVSSIYGQIYQWQESVGQGWIDLVDNAFFQGTKTPQLSIYTTTGMNGFRYRCRILNGNCPEISNPAFLFVNPTPVLFNVTGGGSFCEGGQGMSVGLSSSEVGISYHLYRDGVGTGVVVPGTGSGISMGVFNQPGIYAIKGINGGTGCGIFMLNEVEIKVNPLPANFTVLGGGSYCSGAAAPEIFLSSSEQGVVYELYRNGNALGNIRQGTGFTLSFGAIPETGYYTIRASNVQTGCTRQMAGNAQVIEQAVPQVFAGDDISITTGQTALLTATGGGGSGSYGYQWQPASFVVNPTQATTSTIPLYQSRLFTVVARDLSSQCLSQADSLFVVAAGGPLTVSITTTANIICAGEQVQLQASAGGGNGIYTYSWTSTPSGFTSNEAQIVVSPTVTTTYHIQINDGNQSLSSSITITVNPLPTTFSITGGGSYCQDGSGRVLGLSGSQSGIIYELVRQGLTLASVAGTGNALSFGPQTQAGVYSVRAINSSTQCQRNMSDEANVSITPLPIANAGGNQTIQSGQTALLSGSASGGSGIYQFSWSPENFLINPNSAQAATLPLTATKLFKLRVTDQQSTCVSNENEAIVFVTGGNQLSAQLSASAYSICPGQPVQLTVLASGGSGNYTYSWTSNPPGFSSQSFNPEVNPQQTTRYRVSIMDGFATFTDSVLITVRPAPQVFQLTGGGSFCAGSLAPEVGLSGSQGNVIYSLFRNGEATGVVRQGSGTVLSFGQQSQSGVYSIQAFDLQQLCGRNFPGQVSVEARPLPVANAGSDKTIPFGTSTVLQGSATAGSGLFSFSWSPASLVVQASAQQTATKPLTQTTTFAFLVTDQTTGCQSLPDDVTVVVTGSPLEAQATASQTQVCQGTMVQLSAYATGGNGNYTYHWSSIPAGFYSWDQTLQVLAHQSSSYVLTVSDGVNSARDTIAINVSPMPQVFSLQGGGLACQGGSMPEIKLSGSQPSVRYALIREGNEVASLTGNGSTLVFGQFNQPGNYYAKARTLPGGCEINMNGTATVAAGVSLIVNAGPDKNIASGGQVTLEGQVVAGGSNYQLMWEPAPKLINPQAVQPTTVPLNQTTLFRMSATAQTGGCGTAEDYAVVFVENTASNLGLNLVASQSSVCPGTEVSLFALASGGSGTYSYTWRSVPAGLNFFGNQLKVTPLQTTRYIVTVSDGQLQVSDSLEVLVRNAPQLFSLSGGGYVCEGNQGLALSLSGSEPDITYELLRYGVPTGQSLPGTGQVLAFSNISLQGEYTIRASSTAGCSRIMTGSAVVQTALRPLVLVNPLQQIQAGQSAPLAASVAGNQQNMRFLWTPQNLVVEPGNLITSTLPLQQTTLFYFTATDTVTGCASQPAQSMVVVTGLPLTAGLTASSSNVCQGDTIRFTAIPGGGTGNYTYAWRNSAGQLLGTAAQLRYQAVQPDLITLTISDGQQQATAQQAVDVNPFPQLFSMVGGGSFCSPSPGGVLSLSGSEVGVVYSLYRNQNQLIMQASGTGLPLEFGQFGISGVYTVIAQRTGTSCVLSMAGSAFINMLPALQLQLTPAYTVPFGGTALLTASVSGGSGSFAYQWHPSNKVVNPNQLQTMTVALDASVVFTLTVTDLISGCASSAQTVVYITGGPLNTQIIANASQVCPGQSVRLTAMPQGGSGQYSFQWWSVPAGLQSIQPSVEVYPSVSTWYYLRVTDGTQLRTDSVRVVVFLLPASFTITGGGSACAGGQGVEIGLSGSQSGITYHLLRNGFETGQSVFGTGNPLSFGRLQSAGTYTVRASNQSGCAQLMSGSAMISILPPPQSFILFGGGAACANDNNIALYLTGSETSVTYRLMHNGSTMVQEKLGTGNPISFNTPAVAGTYTVEAVRSGAGCAALMQGSAQVLLYTVPQAAITGGGAMCLGEHVTLTASGGLDYQWLTQPPQTGTTIQVNPSQTTTYAVRVTNGFGCSAQASAIVQVNPLPTFELFNDKLTKTLHVQQGMAGATFIFRSRSTVLQQGTATSFYYGGLSLPGDSLRVEAVSVQGCRWNGYIVLDPEGDETRINAFSPNGDQVNERFMKGSQIRVFNRWGVEIYSGTEGWDGKFNGAPVSPGTYYYVHEIKDLEGNTVRIVKGSVTLVRE